MTDLEKSLIDRFIDHENHIKSLEEMHVSDLIRIDQLVKESNELFEKLGSRSAARTLTKLGYTDNGGELWRPPLGKAPDFVSDINVDGVPMTMTAAPIEVTGDDKPRFAGMDENHTPVHFKFIGKDKNGLPLFEFFENYESDLSGKSGDVLSVDEALAGTPFTDSVHVDPGAPGGDHCASVGVDDRGNLFFSEPTLSADQQSISDSLERLGEKYSKQAESLQKAVCQVPHCGNTKLFTKIPNLWICDDCLVKTHDQVKDEAEEINYCAKEGCTFVMGRTEDLYCFNHKAKD